MSGLQQKGGPTDESGAGPADDPRRRPWDDEEDPRRTLLTALGAMAGVALLVGLAIGVVAVVGLKVAGVGAGADTGIDSAPASLYIPDYQPTASASDDLELPGTPANESPSPSLAEESASPAQAITLNASPLKVAAGGRIDFTGVYGGGEGRTLQIQRKEAGVWTDFPVDATVRGGIFSTWIMTSRTGETKFRVVDTSDQKASNVVTVQIG